MQAQRKPMFQSVIDGASYNVRSSAKNNGVLPTVICVTSGKGGVGKTLTTIHLAASLSAAGLKVLILDGDMGLANVDVMLGITPRFTIYDVIEGHARIQDIILDGPHGIRIIPSGSGIRDLTRLSYIQKVSLQQELAKLDEEIDVMLIDTGAGISDTVMHLIEMADEALVVTTPEPHAMTDAYAAIKVILEDNPKKTIHLAINQVQSETEALKVYQRISDVAQRFLRTAIHYAGCVPFDKEVQSAVAMRKVTQAKWQHTLSGQAWLEMSRKLMPRHQGRTTPTSAGSVLYRIVASKSSRAFVE
jgi:flagellar biosynthesis protein FlhG